jgi:hypothetical protein
LRGTTLQGQDSWQASPPPPPQSSDLEPHPVSHFLQMWKTLQDLWSYSESSRMTLRLAKQIKQLEESEKLQRSLTKSV